MFYDKKVKYLEYCENGQRIRGCGVVKMQKRDKELSMEVVVSGLQTEHTFQRELIICAGETKVKLGEIELRNGKGQFCYQCNDIESLSGMKPYEEWTGLRIDLEEGREIRADFKDKPMRVQPPQRNAVSAAEVTFGTENILKERESAPMQEVRRAEESSIVEEARRAEESSIVEEAHRAEEKSIVTESQQALWSAPTRTKLPSTPRALKEDKWSQLWAVYPHVKPFRDQREYISIRPADFVIFSQESYKNINNSFLLHGFYNYHHLILTRLEKNGEQIYYVGVPGSFFEREKQVAIMFGFESFECEEEPAQAGDFGYYMMRAGL